MSRARVAALKVISRELSVTSAAAEYGYSRQHLHRLIARYRAGGLDAAEARSRRPRSNPQATGDKVREFIVRTRLELTAAGWDAGPVTIAWQPGQAGLHVPPAPAIRRILRAAGLVTPESASGPDPPACGSRPPSPANAGSPTSPTGPWQEAATPRSSTGPATTPATCPAAAAAPRSPARSSSARSC